MITRQTNWSKFQPLLEKAIENFSHFFSIDILLGNTMKAIILIKRNC